MKKRSILPVVLGGISALITMIIAIISLTVSGHVFGGILLLLMGIASASGAVLSYFWHDRYGGLILACSSFISIIATRCLYDSASVNYVIICNWLIVLEFVAILCGFAGSILASYRIKSEDQETNNCFGSLNELRIQSLVFDSDSVIFWIIIVIASFLNGSLITGFACLFALLLVAFGKVLTFVFKNRIGSYIMIPALFLVIIAINPYELSNSNSLPLLMGLSFILVIVDVILEFANTINFHEIFKKSATEVEETILDKEVEVSEEEAVEDIERKMVREEAFDKLSVEELPENKESSVKEKNNKDDAQEIVFDKEVKEEKIENEMTQEDEALAAKKERENVFNQPSIEEMKAEEAKAENANDSKK